MHPYVHTRMHMHTGMHAHRYKDVFRKYVSVFVILLSSDCGQL